MADWVLLGLIGALLVLLLLTLFGFAIYSGLFSEVIVSAGSPPIRNISLAYKFKVGPYSECGKLFTESCSISPKLCSIAVYYDNPHTERKLCAHPRLEIYKGDCIYFVCPLARQGDFYVPEMKEMERKSRVAEAEDAQTDITGADTLSETSSISLEATTDSRETSVATSFLSPFAAGRGRDELDNHSEHSYSESGASGSSFEELDLEGNGDGSAGQPSDLGYAEEQETTKAKWAKEPTALEKERGEE
uniref:Testis expressed 264, ER-phagy receptor n=1 Tax=Chelonoidis abingdonii TaxID=106734 RepID=A0A8C0IV28_CHEAB